MEKVLPKGAESDKDAILKEYEDKVRTAFIYAYAAFSELVE